MMKQLGLLDQKPSGTGDADATERRRNDTRMERNGMSDIEGKLRGSSGLMEE